MGLRIDRDILVIFVTGAKGTELRLGFPEAETEWGFQSSDLLRECSPEKVGSWRKWDRQEKDLSKKFRVQVEPSSRLISLGFDA